MKILELKLRGAIGIKKGIGIDEVEIDFTKFQPGIITLTGKNGCGKTTIMENLHPFRCMVSRTGSLQSHFFLKDSYRSLKFEMDGNIYEAKILIDALTGGTEAYLKCNDVAMNDGKVTTYDEVLEGVVGSQDLFFSSVFSGQKSKGIAELKAAERRKLFYELLNLSVYDNYLEVAKTKLKDAELNLSKLEGELAATNTGIDLPGVEQDLINTNQYMEKQIGEIAICEKAIKEAKEKLTQLLINESEINLAIKRNDELLTENRSKENELTRVTNAYETTNRTFQDEEGKQKNIITHYKAYAANKEVIISKLEELKTVKAKISDLQKEEIIIRKEYSDYQDDNAKGQAELNELAKELPLITESINYYKKALSDAISTLRRYKQDRDLIEGVPCGEIGQSCQFISNAFQNSKEIDSVKIGITNFENELKKVQDEHAKKYSDYTSQKETFDTKHKAKVSEFTGHLNKVGEKLREANAKLNELNLKDWSKINDELNAAETEIKLAEERITSIKSQILTLTENFSKAEEKLKTEIKEIQSKFDYSVNDKSKTIQDEIGHLRYSIWELDEEKLPRLKTELRSSQEEIVSITNRIEFEKNQIAKRDTLTLKRSTLEQEVKDWAFLVKAFDKTGIPVLKLENSGVQITSVANELLSLFDNKFRIVFETTSLTKDKKKLKETFDINVVEENGVCEISNKSGGQQVWLETAIQLAISLVVRQQGRNIQTSFLDEKDGALDLDNALSYIDMLKKAHEMSGVHNTFIITHRSELLELIPQQIKLVDGYLQIMN